MIDGLVRDIGSFAVDVHMAERTLATDPRTRAAQLGLTIQDSRNLVRASQDLIKRAGRNAARAVELRRAAPRPRRRRR